MKKAIRLMILVLAVFSLSACSKTTMNSIAITGNWEHYKTEKYIDGVAAGSWYPTTDGYRIFYNFNSEGLFVQTKESISNPAAASTEEGTWLVDGDLLLLTYIDGTDRYYIEHAGLLELTLKYVYRDGGHNCVDYLTLKK
ncbi:MAG: hypothetical protein K5843_07220 [Bacteroidales bacterium]|nr:hypothetical protein [Bacteroidales bacterium]